MKIRQSHLTMIFISRVSSCQSFYWWHWHFHWHEYLLSRNGLSSLNKWHYSVSYRVQKSPLQFVLIVLGSALPLCKYRNKCRKGSKAIETNCMNGPYIFSKGVWSHSTTSMLSDLGLWSQTHIQHWPKFYVWPGTEPSQTVMNGADMPGSWQKTN